MERDTFGPVARTECFGSSDLGYCLSVMNWVLRGHLVLRSAMSSSLTTIELGYSPRQGDTVHMRDRWIRAARKDFERFSTDAQSICLTALTIAAQDGKADIAKTAAGGSEVASLKLLCHCAAIPIGHGLDPLYEQKRLVVTSHDADRVKFQGCSLGFRLKMCVNAAHIRPGPDL